MLQFLGRLVISSNASSIPLAPVGYASAPITTQLAVAGLARNQQPSAESAESLWDCAA